MNDPAWFAQTSYRARLEWGRRGARDAANRGDVLVIVDALCFSTCVAIALSHGATIYPCAKGEDTPERAAALNAEIAVRREQVPAQGRFSLSPATLHSTTAETRLLLASPNGATCTRYGSSVPALFAGAFVNAEAVANAVGEYLKASPNRAVTVIACGERWEHPDPDDGDLRFALEDYLAAGAILSHLPGNLVHSPESQAAIAAFTATRANLLDTLRATGSGIELIERGYPSDVEETSLYNSLSIAPRLRDGAFTV